MSDTTEATKRPWDGFFAETDIKEDDVMFVVAANMIKLYSDGDFEFSARLRDIISNHGQNRLNQRCARLMSDKLHFDRPRQEGMTGREKVAQAGLEQERSDIKPPNLPTSRPSSLKRKASESENEPEISKNQNKDQLFHDKKDIKPTNILLGGDFAVHHSEAAASKRVKLTCDWSSMSGFDPDQDTEPLPPQFEPTAKETVIWANAVISAAGSNELHGFNVVPSVSISASSEEIINVKPNNNKPSFRFEPSSIASRLPGFLAQMKAANDELAAGNPEQHIMELSDSDTASEHIEMNLGLGVLEQLRREPEPFMKFEDKK